MQREFIFQWEQIPASSIGSGGTRRKLRQEQVQQTQNDNSVWKLELVFLHRFYQTHEWSSVTCSQTPGKPLDKSLDISMNMFKEFREWKHSSRVLWYHINSMLQSYGGSLCEFLCPITIPVNPGVNQSEQSFCSLWTHVWVTESGLK